MVSEYECSLLLLCYAHPTTGYILAEQAALQCCLSRALEKCVAEWPSGFESAQKQHTPHTTSRANIEIGTKLLISPL
ncbi:hypothetical protein GQ54DRAFT_298822 [Martensiomyces pterosporus]|nr:hypothetical protein GQ54DRAFT_298822 [Martensiomyces pterosporus]